MTQKPLLTIVCPQSETVCGLLHTLHPISHTLFLLALFTPLCKRKTALVEPLKHLPTFMVRMFRPYCISAFALTIILSYWDSSYQACICFCFVWLVLFDRGFVKKLLINGYILLMFKILFLCENKKVSVWHVARCHQVHDQATPPQ